MIAGSVNLLRFSEAIARAGLVGRYDADRECLVIEPQTAIAAALANDTRIGMAWWSRLTEPERAYWLEAAGSAVPADAWRKFQSGYPPP